MLATQKQEHHTGKRPRRYNNPLQRAVYAFLIQHTQGLRKRDAAEIDIDALTYSIPKRYTIYRPLLLLPANFFSISPSWQGLLDSLGSRTIETLYRIMVEIFKPHGVTHIAVNSPISPIASDGISNVTRSPSNLVLLHGNFGPRVILEHGIDSLNDGQPSPLDFQAAFWVSSMQGNDIVQIWAPLWTMFSRGNSSEKARILGRGSGDFPGLDGRDGLLRQDLRSTAIVDMYIGIGYFAFPYLRRGVGRVWGWEINGWSIEGLRRGCRENGWIAKVLKVDEEGTVVDEEGRIDDVAIQELAQEIGQNDELRVVAFWGDNRWAARVVDRIKQTIVRSEAANGISWLDIRHINLGLLPSSRLAWEAAADILDADQGGWVHVHENAGIHEIKEKVGSIVGQFQTYGGASKEVACSHIEHVKTYAPGVMHCVFDVHVQPRSYTTHSVEGK